MIGGYFSGFQRRVNDRPMRFKRRVDKGSPSHVRCIPDTGIYAAITGRYSAFQLCLTETSCKHLKTNLFSDMQKKVDISKDVV